MLLNSMSNRRLLAAVGTRAGTKSPFTGLKKWSQVKRIFEVWAENMRKELDSLRGA